MFLVTLCAVLMCFIALSTAQLPPDFRLDEYPSYGAPRTPQFTFSLIGYSLAVDPVDGRRYIAGGVPAGVPQILPTAGIFVASADKRSFSREVELLVPAPYTDASDFGTAVDIAGDFAVVSSPSSLNAATGVTGHVFVYRRAGAAWTQQAPALVIPNPDVDTCRFGRSLSLFGTQLLVGCPGNPAVFNFTSAAFLFDLTTGALISAFETAQGPGLLNYGTAVALTATHAFVSQLFFNSTSGLLHIFDLAAGTNTTFLGDFSQFGRSLSAENGTVLVGASGSAHLLSFNASAGAYQIEKSFTPVSVEYGHGDFGRDVSLLANRALIGAPTSNGKIQGTGSAQVYARDAATGLWGPNILVGATDGIVTGQYGMSVGLSRDQVFVGSVGGYCQTCAAFTPGVVYVYSQANSCGVPPVPDSPTVCSPQKQIFYFNPDLFISSPVVLTNPVVFIGNVSIGANVTAFINNSIPPITSFGCVNVTSGSLRIELTESVTSNIIIANSRCVSGVFETVELAPLPDDCRDYKIIGQDNDPATGSLILVLDIDSSGCSSDLAKKRGIIAGAVIGGVLLIAASVAVFFYLGFKLRWRFLDSVFHKREDATTLHV